MFIIYKLTQQLIKCFILWGGDHTRFFYLVCNVWYNGAIVWGIPLTGKVLCTIRSWVLENLSNTLAYLIIEMSNRSAYQFHLIVISLNPLTI